MYHRNGKCEHARMSTAENREECLRELGVLEEAKASADKIRAYLIVDAYFSYKVGKTILDKLTEEEYKALLDEEAYAEWPMSSKLSYGEMKKVLVNHLRRKHHDS